MPKHISGNMNTYNIFREKKVGRFRQKFGKISYAFTSPINTVTPFSLGGEMFSPGGAMFSLGGGMFSPGDEMFSPGGEMFSSGGEMFSLGGEMFSLGGEMFSLGGEMLSLGETKGSFNGLTTTFFLNKSSLTN